MDVITEPNLLKNIQGGQLAYKSSWLIDSLCLRDVMEATFYGLGAGLMVGTALDLGDVITGYIILAFGVSAGHWAYTSTRFCQLEPGYYTV